MTKNKGLFILTSRENRLFITVTELHTTVAVNTAQVIVIVLVHRCYLDNTSYANQLLKLCPNLYLQSMKLEDCSA